jgi:hypothetical protein
LGPERPENSTVAGGGKPQLAGFALWAKLPRLKSKI